MNKNRHLRAKNTATGGTSAASPRTEHRCQGGEPCFESGPAFNKPALGVLKTDAEVARWAKETVAAMDFPSNPAGCDQTNPNIQLACFMIASSILGADEHRLGRILGLDDGRVGSWAANLRRNGLWLADGTVVHNDWLEVTIGNIAFTSDCLVASGLVERKVDPIRGAVYRAIPGRNLWEVN